MLEELYKLVNDIEEIPGKEFYDLEKNLFTLKENLKSELDCEILESYTSSCIQKASELQKRNLELLLKGHQLENIFCRIRQRADDFSTEEKNNTKKLLEQKTEELFNEAQDLGCVSDTGQLPMYFTLCKLYVYISNGYTNQKKFDKALKCLKVCEEWIDQPQRRCQSEPQDSNDKAKARIALEREHVAYYHYGLGRHYRDILSNSPDQDVQVVRSKAIEHFNECIKEFQNIYDKSGYHLEEIIMNKLHLVRVYLDIKRAGVYETKERMPTHNDLEMADEILSKATEYYDDLLEQYCSSARLRLETRILWCKSTLFCRLYHFTGTLEKNTTSRTMRNILLRRTRLYCQQAWKKLEHTGYSEKRELEEFMQHVDQQQLSPCSTPGLYAEQTQAQGSGFPQLEHNPDGQLPNKDDDERSTATFESESASLRSDLH